MEPRTYEMYFDNCCLPVPGVACLFCSLFFLFFKNIFCINHIWTLFTL